MGGVTRGGGPRWERVTWVWRGDLGRGTQVGGGDPGLGDLGEGRPWGRGWPRGRGRR